MSEEPLDYQSRELPTAPKMPLRETMLFILGIAAVYMLGVYLYNLGESEAGLANLVVDFFLMIGQVAVNIVVGIGFLFSKEYQHVGKAMLLIGLLMVLIGFGTCVGLMAFG